MDMAFEVVGINYAVAARIYKLEISVVLFDDFADAVARYAGRRLDDAYQPAGNGVE